MLIPKYLFVFFQTELVYLIISCAYSVFYLIFSLRLQCVTLTRSWKDSPL